MADNENFKIIAMKKLFLVSIIIHVLSVCVAVLVSVLARNGPFGIWGIAVIVMFVLIESGAVAISFISSLAVIVNRNYIEIKGIRGVYAKLEIDSIENIIDGIYFNGLYKSRAIRIIFKDTPQKYKKSLFFRGKEILVEINDKKINRLKELINNDRLWNN